MRGQDIFDLLIVQTWQVAVLAIVAWVAVRIFATDRPHLAHAIWALVLIKCMVPPIMSSPVSPFSWIEARSSETQTISQSTLAVQPSHLPIQPPGSVSAIPATSEQTPASVLNSNAIKLLLSGQPKNPIDRADSPVLLQSETTSEIDAAAALPTSFRLNQRQTKSWLIVVIWCWLVGAAIGLALMTIRFAVFWHWLNKSPAVEAIQVEACVKKLSQQLGIRLPVSVKVSARPVGPAVIGVIRPTILLPSAMIENKTDAEIEPLIAHELIHVRRGDLWWAMLQTVATSLFWFHPLVWIASKLLTRESERCCDEETIAGLGCRPADYARRLLEVLERKHQLRVAPALPGVRPVEITSARLERVMRLGNGIQKRTPVWVWLVMLVCGAVVLPGAAWAVIQEESAAEAQTEVGASSKLSATSAATESTQNSQYQEHRFEVGDLLQKVRDNKVVNQSAESILIGELTPFDAIKDTMKLLLDGESRYKPIRGGRISGTQLIVNETPERVEQIQKAIDNAREVGFDQIVAETRFLKTNQEQIKTLGIEWEQVKSDASVNASPPIVFDPSGKQPKVDFPSLTLPTREGIHAVSHIDHSAPVLFSVVPEMELQRIIKMSASRDRISMMQAPTVTLFNGQDAEVSAVSQRPFVTGVKDAKATTENPTGKDAIISIFEEGTRMRVKAVLKENTVELDCHVQLREIADVKTVHVSHDTETDAGTSIQVPTIVATNVEVKRKISLGDTLLLEMLCDEGGTENDTLVLMLTCQKVSPPWAKESDGEKKRAAERVAAIAAAKASPVVVKEEPTTEDVMVIKAANRDESSDQKPREFDVMGMKFSLEGDVKFEVRNNEIIFSGTKISLQCADEFACSCEKEGFLKFVFDENDVPTANKLVLHGDAKLVVGDEFEWEADNIDFCFTDGAMKATLNGDVKFHCDNMSGASDQLFLDQQKDPYMTLSGRVCVYHSPDGKPKTIVRGDKVVVSVVDGERRITVDSDFIRSNKVTGDRADAVEEPIPSKSPGN